MSEIMPLLRDLHAIDRQLIRLKKRLLAGPKEIALVDERRAAAAAARKNVEDAIRAAALALDRLQLDQRAAQAELSDQDRKLKAVKNNTEYRIVTDRIKELRRRIDEGETALLRGMEDMDARRKGLEDAARAADDAEAERAALAAKVEAQAKEIKAERRGLKQKRDLAVEKIRAADEQAYALYDAALHRTHGDALATLSGDTCQACFMKQNPAVVNAAMVGNDLRLARCGGCGRILSAASEDL